MTTGPFLAVQGRTLIGQTGGAYPHNQTVCYGGAPSHKAYHQSVCPLRYGCCLQRHQTVMVVTACHRHVVWACRLLRHDMVAELCTSAVRYQQAGGTASVLPKGASSGQALLPGPAADTALFVYGNVEVKNLVTAKFGPGIQFEVPKLPLNVLLQTTEHTQSFDV